MKPAHCLDKIVCPVLLYIQNIESQIEAGRKIESEMKLMKNEVKFSNHLGLVKEYRKVSDHLR